MDEADTAAHDTVWTVRPNPDVGCWQVVTACGAVIADMVLDERYARRIADDHNALALLDRDLRAIHARDNKTGPDGHGLYGCTGCDDGETWPCPTIQALNQATNPNGDPR